jgi:PAS domain-containing protein
MSDGAKIAQAVWTTAIAVTRGLEGLWRYVAALVAMALSLVALRIAFEQPRRGNEATKALEDLLRMPQEPTRPSARPTLAAAVVGNLAAKDESKTGWNLCKASSAFRESLDRSDEVFEWLYYRPMLPTAERRPPPQIEASAQSLGLPTLSLPGNRKVVVATTLVAPLGVGVAHTEPPDVNASALRIPAQLAPDDAQIERERVGSIAIEALKPRLFIRAANATEPELKRIYFISVEGLMRLLPADNLEAMPPQRPFNHANYVVATLDNEDTDAVCSIPANSVWARYTSLPYLDLLGLGIVATTCYPVPRDRTIMRAEGVFCLDYSIPESVLYEHIQRNGIFDVSLFEFQQGPAVRTLKKCKVNRNARSCSDLVDEQEDDFVRLTNWMTKNLHCVPGSSGCADAAGLGDGREAVVLRRTREETGYGSVLVAVLSYRSTSLGGNTYWAIGVAIVSALASLLLLVWARVRVTKREQAALIRGLQLGVLRVDQFHNVIEANDRATAILKRDITRFGLGKRSTLPRSDLLFENSLRRRDSQGRPEVLTIDEIDEQRQRGRSSTYWAKLKVAPGGLWVQVHGSPIVASDGVHSFALIEPEDNETFVKQLDASL